MDAPDLGPIDEYIPIPKEFWSFAEDRPFEHCMVCNKPLLEDGRLYLIEKAYKKSEVVFEYAQQSLRLIDHYFDEHVDLVKRRKGLIESYDEEISPWLSHCLITGKPASECEEYQIMTLCDGEDLLFTYIPCLISGKAMETIQGILSKKTRDRLDGFVEEFLGLPPEAKNPTPYIG